ncbi:MAG: SapC family protein [Alcaligenaceae bacterium]|nr:SapC family protein [Alcaligenaceae bacterium]
MSSIQAVSRDRHANKRWKRYSSYAFAAHDPVSALVLQELPKACMALPVAFVASGEAYIPVAVQGLQAGQNLLVSDEGRWLGRYVPAVYRGYPFVLLPSADGQQVLCVNEDSGLVNDTEGEPFFDEQGEPVQQVKDVLNFLSQVATNRAATERVCALLKSHGLIQSWDIKVQSGEAEQLLQGLFRIDEAAFNALPLEALDALRAAGALPVIYCQLLSMQHLPVLGQLAQIRAAQNAPLPQSGDGDLDLEFLNESGTIKFGV